MSDFIIDKDDYEHSGDQDEYLTYSEALSIYHEIKERSSYSIFKIQENYLILGITNKNEITFTTFKNKDEYISKIIEMQLPGNKQCNASTAIFINVRPRGKIILPSFKTTVEDFVL